MVSGKTIGYDTVVIGGGTAGCVVASRLSEDPGHRVLLVEAGPDYGPADSGRWPAEIVSSRFFPISHDWGYTARTAGRPMKFLRGRVMGGSSAINAAGIQWGARADYDEWGALGNAGWDFAGLLPYFQRVERERDASGAFHGRDGQVTVTRAAVNSPYVEDLLQAYAADGIPWTDDLNDPELREGVGRTSSNAVDGRRMHAAAAYLDQARGRPNLTLFDESTVDRIEWRAGRAARVRLRQHDGARWIQANRFVLCAGAIGTPAILQRSGIGPAGLVTSMVGAGRPIHDLAGVGANLRDHPGVALEFEAAPGVLDRLASVFAGRPFVRETQVVVKAKSRPELDWFDLNLVQWHGVRPPGYADHNRLRFPIFLMHPAATGSVRIESADPSVQPAIETGFGVSEDVEALACGLERLRRIAEQPAVHDWFGPERYPGPEYRGAALRQWIARNFRTYNHCSGTARLGGPDDPGAVVDGRGRVHGLENLYVADASIMPTIPRSAINFTVFAIAEKIVVGLRSQKD